MKLFIYYYGVGWRSFRIMGYGFHISKKRPYFQNNSPFNKDYKILKYYIIFLKPTNHATPNNTD